MKEETVFRMEAISIPESDWFGVFYAHEIRCTRNEGFPFVYLLKSDKMEGKEMSGLLQSIQENVIFLLEFLAVVAALFCIAYAAEKFA